MCVPPDFNETMKAVWERLWEAMPQSRKVSVTVKQLLQYKERCQAERSQKKDESTPALLPVSFAQAFTAAESSFRSHYSWHCQQGSKRGCS